MLRVSPQRLGRKQTFDALDQLEAEESRTKAEIAHNIEVSEVKSNDSKYFLSSETRLEFFLVSTFFWEPLL